MSEHYRHRAWQRYEKHVLEREANRPDSGPRPLLHQPHDPYAVAPWEGLKHMADFDKVVEGYRLILKGLGLSLTDPHLQDTPERAAKALYHEMCRGITGDPPKITTFPDQGPAQMVVLRNIPVRSLCAHHLLPFFGTAVVGYVTGNRKILGLSKLSRIVDFHSRRPQVQERLTLDIAEDLWKRVQGADPGGVGVLLRARHLCMEIRGVTHTSDMVTSALRGEFEKPEVRAEFLKLAESA